MAVVTYSLYSAIAILLFLRLLVVLRSRRYHAANATRLGCQEPVILVNSLPLGFDFMYRLFKRSRAGTAPEMFLEDSERLARAYTYGVRLVGELELVTADPANIKAMLSTQFQDFSLGPTRKGALRPLIDGGIFASDGSAWEHSRAMLRPQFARDQISKLEIEETHVRHLIRAITVSDETSWTNKLDLQVLFFRLTLDSATDFLFGESVNSQVMNASAGNELLPKGVETIKDEVKLSKALERTGAWMDTRLNLGTYYWLADGPSLRSSCKDVHDFIDYFVQRALTKQPVKETPDQLGHESKKERFIFLESLAEQTRDPTELQVQLLSVLLAGRDTTAALMGWIFYMLARHPRVYEKLRTQILQDLGSYDSPKNLTFEGLKNCRYLQYVISETQRLCPVVPFNARYADKDTTLPVGGGTDGKHPIYIPAGQEVFLNLFTMYRREDIWGSDAAEFKPERWELVRHGWEYIPFGGGPRTCLGQQFALTETAYVVVRLLQRFEEMENLDPSPLQHRLSLTDCSRTGVIVRFKEAADVKGAKVE